MREGPDVQNEALILRGILAGLTLETKLIRLRRQLIRVKGWETQPRAPAGESDGGQWIGGAGGNGGSSTESSVGSAGAEPAPTAERTTLEDGTRVLSIRIRAGRRSFDEQHTVVAPTGASRVFETSGATQTIRDGESGDVLSRSTFTATELVAEPVAQPAFLQAAPLIALQVVETFELALALFGALSDRDDGYGTVLGFTAQDYTVKENDPSSMPIWVGRLDQAGLDAACPRNGEVQAIVDDVSARVKARGGYADATELGRRIHAEIAQIVNSQHDPNFVAELILAEKDKNYKYILRGSSRADIFERTHPYTACIYDTKTGRRGLTRKQALALIRSAQRNFPDLLRYIIIQARPNR